MSGNSDPQQVGATALWVWDSQVDAGRKPAPPSRETPEEGAGTSQREHPLSPYCRLPAASDGFQGVWTACPPRGSSLTRRLCSAGAASPSPEKMLAPSLPQFPAQNDKGARGARPEGTQAVGSWAVEMQCRLVLLGEDPAAGLSEPGPPEGPQNASTGSQLRGRCPWREEGRGVDALRGERGGFQPERAGPGFRWAGARPRPHVDSCWV